MFIILRFLRSVCDINVIPGLLSNTFTIIKLAVVYLLGNNSCSERVSQTDWVKSLSKSLPIISILFTVLYR